MSHDGWRSGRVALITRAGMGIGAAVAFLASDEASDVSRQTIAVDGGFLRT